MPDSMSYLGAATAVAAGHGLRIPMADWDDADSTAALEHYPPGVPLLLAGPIALGADAPAAARLLDAASAMALVVAAGAAIADAGAPAWLALVLLLALRGITTAQVTALSEPPFLALTALTLLLMARHPERPLRYGTAALAAAMVRYAGGALVLAAGAWAALHAGVLAEDAPRTAPRTRLLRAVRAGVLAGLPALVGEALWLSWAARHGLDAVRRPPHWTGTLGAGLVEGGLTLTEHLAPVGLGMPWRLAAAAGAAVLVAALAWPALRRRPAGDPARRLLLASGVLVGCYATFVAYAKAFTWDDIPFDDRILGPMLLAAGLAAVAALVPAWGEASPPARRAGAAAALLWLAAGAWQSVAAVRALYDERWDYLGPRYLASPVADWLRGPGRGVTLWTTDPAAVFFTTGRPSRLLPDSILAGDSLALAHAIASRPTAIVAWKDGFLPTVAPDSLARALGLCPAIEAEAGGVWLPRCPR